MGAARRGPGGGVAALALCAALTGCESVFHGFSVVPPEEAARPPAVIDARERLERAPPGEVRSVAVLEGAPHASMNLVRVHGRVPPHRHRRSDETIYVLEGEGDLLLDREWLPIRAGMLVHVPRGVAHAFVNRAEGGTLALSTFTPPFVAGDREALPEAAPDQKIAP